LYLTFCVRARLEGTPKFNAITEVLPFAKFAFALPPRFDYGESELNRFEKILRNHLRVARCRVTEFGNNFRF
jgi:hypothetical protein